HAHARIVRVDGDAARAIRGVLAVWSAADLPVLGQPLTTGGSKERGFVVPLLAGERARYVGEPVAVVVAETAALAADGRDAESGVLTVWASIQSPYSQRDVIARVLGLPAARVRVIVPDVGGAFGPKGQVYADEVLVATAAFHLGRPVKWSEGRREHLQAVGHDREQLHEASIAFTSDGTIAALEDRFLADVGAYPVMGNGLTANTVNHLPGPYRVPHYRR